MRRDERDLGRGKELTRIIRRAVGERSGDTSFRLSGWLGKRRGASLPAAPYIPFNTSAIDRALCSCHPYSMATSEKAACFLDKSANSTNNSECGIIKEQSAKPICNPHQHSVSLN